MAVPRAIFFDLDDTLIFAHGRPRATWRAVLSEFEGRFGDPVKGKGTAALCEALMAQARWFWSDPERHREGRLDLLRARRDMVGATLGGLGINDERLRDDIVEAFEARRWRDMHLLPGSHETLDALAGQGFRLALVTNGASTPQRAKIERFELTERFDHIQIEGEFGQGKPDPAVYHHLLESLEVSAEEAWMVGDNLEWEVAAPQRLGILGIWCNSGGHAAPAGSTILPDHTITSVTELPALIDHHATTLTPTTLQIKD